MFTKIKYRESRLLTALIILLSAMNAHAQTRDPINIEADNAKIIEKEGKSIYSGHVVLIQGNIRLTADVLTVQSKDGKLTRITAQGKPVTYYEKKQPDGKDIAGEAYLLEYYATEDRVLLLDNAKLSQGRTAFSGNRIEYNTTTDVVTAEVSETGSERVQVTIQPEESSKKPSPANPK